MCNAIDVTKWGILHLIIIAILLVEDVSRWGITPRYVGQGPEVTIRSAGKILHSRVHRATILLTTAEAISIKGTVNHIAHKQQTGVNITILVKYHKTRRSIRKNRIYIMMGKIDIRITSKVII